MNQPPQLYRRREVLRSLVGSSLLLPGLVSRLLAEDSADPLAPKPSHFPGKAKRVIFIFSNGGVSHMDTFDHKPRLFAADGKTMGIGGGLSNQQRRLLKPGWEFLKRVRGIETRMTTATATATSANRYYIAGGSWWGNDTLWRMIYDLNLIIRHVDAAGRLHDQAQRDYFCIVDGLISGEGNGPLQPLPRDTDWLVFGEDPFAIDAALTWFMGFDPNKIPVIERRKQFAGSDWGRFSLEELEVAMDGDPQALVNSPINFHFAPPPGWRDHIER